MARTHAKDKEKGTAPQHREQHEEHGEHELPMKGETYRCAGCGMELEITEDCGCEDPEHVRLECCGAPMSLVT